MSDGTKLVTTSTRYDRKVTPVKRRRTRGTVYETEYSFNDIILDFNPDDVFVDKAITRQMNSAVFYRYPNKPMVMIKEDGVYNYNGNTKKEGQEQAFFVLSQMEAEGYVTGWRKS